MITYILFAAALLWFTRDAIQRKVYKQKLANVPLRIHVNGIRGKTSLTRYVAAALRAHGYKVFAKTTGTSARVIDDLGGEMAIHRQGLPNISEQLKIMSFFIDQKPDAVVIECMAVNPIYSDYLEKKIMDSNIYIFSNVFIDHIDQLGSSLDQIAISMTQGFPVNSIIITTESNPELLNIMKTKAWELNSQIINANNIDYRLDDINEFNHVPMEQNIKIVLALATLLMIPRKTALAAIKNCRLDEGQSTVIPIPHNIRDIQFANLFAVNDINSFESKVHEIASLYPSHRLCVVLNNRLDRYERVSLFLESVLKLKIPYVVSLGQCGQKVSMFCKKHEISHLRLDEDIKEARLLEGKELIDCMISFVPEFSNIVIIGAVNIHSKQSKHILQYLRESLDKRV